MKLPKNKINKMLRGAVTAGIATGSLLLSVLPASASNLTSASVLLSGSRPSSSSVTYTWRFNVGTSTVVKCIDTTYSTSATAFGAGTAPTGLSTASATLGTITGLTGSYVLNNVSAYEQQVSDGTGSTPLTSAAISIPINAMVNPSSEGNYYARIITYTDQSCTTATDSVVVIFRIQNGVTVSAVVDPTLTFTVAGIANPTTFKGTDAVSLGCTDTATAVSFPTAMVPDTTYACAQSLTTSTNADKGYSVTLRGVHTTGNFLKATVNEIADSTGSDATPASFPTASGTVAFGYTTSDATLSTTGGTTGRFSATDTYAAVPIATLPQEVAYDSAPVSGQAINVGYKFRFSGTTKAGSYTGTVVYVATPVF